MREIKLRVQVLRPLASCTRGALPLVGGVCWGVTAGNVSHNAIMLGVSLPARWDATLVLINQESLLFLLHTSRLLKIFKFKKYALM